MTENQYGIIRIEKGATETEIVEHGLNKETANKLVKEYNISEQSNPNAFYTIAYGVVMAK